MTTIPIKDPERAMIAGSWAKKNFSDPEWSLDIQGLFTPACVYFFKFKHSKQATLFALRWA